MKCLRWIPFVFAIPYAVAMDLRPLMGTPFHVASFHTELDTLSRLTQEMVTRMSRLHQTTHESVRSILQTMMLLNDYEELRRIIEFTVLTTHSIRVAISDAAVIQSDVGSIRTPSDYVAMHSVAISVSNLAIAMVHVVTFAASVASYFSITGRLMSSSQEGQCWSAIKNIFKKCYRSRRIEENSVDLLMRAAHKMAVNVRVATEIAVVAENIGISLKSVVMHAASAQGDPMQREDLRVFVSRINAEVGSTVARVAIVLDLANQCTEQIALMEQFH